MKNNYWIPALAGIAIGILIGVFLLQANVFYRIIITNEKQISEAMPERVLKSGH